MNETEEKQVVQRAPVWYLFGFALVIAGLNLAGIAGLGLKLVQNEARIEQVCATSAGLISEVDGKLATKPTPQLTASPSAVPTQVPVKTYYNYYTPTPVGR